MTQPPVLILGARSDIARATAQAFAEAGHPLQLAARRAATLAADAKDLSIRHDVPVTTHEFDAVETQTHDAFLSGLPELPGIVVCAVGALGDQDEDQSDPAAGLRTMRANFEGPAHILAYLANAFERRGSGTIVGISSVAGERGRATNYVYGAAKAGFTAFLSGLRNRLNGTGVHVITVKPGFVRTAMTKGMDLPDRLTADPEEVAAAILRAVDRRRDVVYVRPVWRAVMWVIRALPEPVFKRLRI